MNVTQSRGCIDVACTLTTMTVLQTARLELVPMTRELHACELEISARRGERLGARVFEGYPGEYERDAQENFIANFLEEGSRNPALTQMERRKKGHAVTATRATMRAP